MGNTRDILNQMTNLSEYAQEQERRNQSIARSFQLAEQYYKGEVIKKDKQQALKHLKDAADLGSKLAQYNVGMMYYDDPEIKQDYQEAARYFTLSANQDYAPAQRALAAMYYNGHGEKNLRKAVELYMLAANNGDALAQAAMGNLCSVGFSNENGAVLVEKNIEKAFNFYYTSAWHGNPQAQNNLGLCYEEGSGTEKDLHQAIIWYEAAAKKGSTEAQQSLARLQASLAANNRDQQSPTNLPGANGASDANDRLPYHCRLM